MKHGECIEHKCNNEANDEVIKMKKRLEISKISDKYWRVYENNGKVAKPYSPREFIKIV